MKNNPTNFRWKIWCLVVFALLGIKVSWAQTVQDKIRTVNVKIGHLSPYQGHPISLPGIERGIARFRAEGKSPQLNISIKYLVDSCDPKQGTANAVQIVQEGVDAILGNYCSRSCTPGGYYVSAQNVPYWPSGCADDMISNKSTFNSFVRFYPSGTSVGPVFTKIFQSYKWKRAVIWNRDIGTCSYGMDSLSAHFRANNITIAEWIRVDPNIVSFSDREIDIYLSRLRTRGRIIITCHSEGPTAQFVRRAHALGMTGSDYVIFAFSLVPSAFLDAPWKTSETLSPAEMTTRKEAFHAMKVVTIADMTHAQTNDYVESIRKEANSRWNISFTSRIHISVMMLEDLTYAYLNLITDLLNEGQAMKDLRNGSYILERAKGIKFQGQTGQIVIDENGDREPVFWMMQYTKDMDNYEPYGYVGVDNNGAKFIEEFSEASWRTADGNPPPSEPVCGFKGEKCPEDTSDRDIIIIVIVLIFIIGLSVTTGIVLYIRNKRMEEDLQKMTWKIKYSDLGFGKMVAGSAMCMSSRSIRSLANDSVSEALSQQMQVFTKIALYNGVSVAVKSYNVNQPLHLTRTDLIELKTMKDMAHDNINTFVGACIDLPNICTLGLYCPKGSLQDILGNDEINLDWTFKTSLMNDTVNGLYFLHESPLGSHGNLKSSNCLVDSRWVLKLSNFGLSVFKAHQSKKEESEYASFRNKLWTAPELLRNLSSSIEGSQPGDIYSFGIMLQEIVYRCMPFFLESVSLTPKDIIEQVVKGTKDPLRPKPPVDNKGETEAQSKARVLMTNCWQEEPSHRPSIKEVKRKLRDVNGGKNINIMDVMIQKLERYASNLEDIVTHRTAELLDEKKKTDMLLYRMLPPTVADRLKKGLPVEAELYDQVTIYFSDIVGFTSLSSESTPMEVINLLNDLYTMFDRIIDLHDVYKVETIGDAYMVVSGLPNRNEGHVAEICHMALNLLSETTSFQIKHKPGTKLFLRAGIHTGPCAAGVVGLSMPRYCLFGDTVNMASRMESNGEALMIHLSEEASTALRAFPEYRTEERGIIPIKGKGHIKTYWLTGKEDFNKPLPLRESSSDK